jgi:hypothetical protein
MKRIERCRVLCAAAMLVLSACGFAVAGDAQADCSRLEAIFSKLGERCGGHALAPEVLGCDELLLSAMTASDVDECERWADEVDCASIEAPDWRPPEACRFRAIRLP